jgi:tetratricopeptide (TPR) repeat protein
MSFIRSILSPLTGRRAAEREAAVKVLTIEETFDGACAHQEAGRREQAEDLFRDVLARERKHPEALGRLARLCADKGSLVEASRLLQSAVQAAPDVLKHRLNRAMFLSSLDRHGEAMLDWREAVRIDPEPARHHHMLALSCRAVGRVDEAIASARSAVGRDPAYLDAQTTLADLLINAGRFAEAVEPIKAAVALGHRTPQSYADLCTALRLSDKEGEAASAFRDGLEALEADGHAYDIGRRLAQMGERLLKFEMGEEAAVCLRRAVALFPEDPQVRSHLAMSLGILNQFDSAIAELDEAIRLSPDVPRYRYNRGIALLTIGDLEKGWKDFEARLLLPGMERIQTLVGNKPRWDGQLYPGRTLLVLQEQGLGDTIQFGRFAALAAARGMRVFVEVQGPLRELMKTLSGVEIAGPGDPIPQFDFFCPMCSLPLAFGTTPDDLPSEPYLSADPERVEAWRERLSALPAGLRVGIAWQGNWDFPFNAVRSLQPEALLPLGQVPGVNFVSLQKYGTPPEGLRMTDFMADVSDMADTAALMANLDLVISVDTSVAHLAGAMGKPVSLLIRHFPCWRWLLDRRDSPWYPTMHIYRQARPGDWGGVIAEVAADLGKTAAA